MKNPGAPTVCPKCKSPDIRKEFTDDGKGRKYVYYCGNCGQDVTPKGART